MADEREVLSPAEALNQIADLGSCAHDKTPAYRLFQQALDIATGALSSLPSRDQDMAVDIVDGRLIISIGVDALMVAVKGGPVWSDQEEEERGWVISDPDAFAAEIAHELQDKEDDGTTLVHVMLDAAIERAIDQGSLSIDFGKDA